MDETKNQKHSIDIWSKNGTPDENEGAKRTKMIGNTIQATGQILDKYSQTEIGARKRTRDRNLTTSKRRLG